MTSIVHIDTCGFVYALWTTRVALFDGQTPTFTEAFKTSKYPFHP